MTVLDSLEVPRLGITLLAFLAMEPVSWLIHRYVMHGFGWGWHRTHHERQPGWFEKNDYYALLFSGLGFGLFVVGVMPAYRVAWFIGAGVTLYGAVYFLVHDGLSHQRFKLPWRLHGAYLRRLIQAHRLHHATHERDGAVSFGFLFARNPRKLKQELSARRSSSSATEQHTLEQAALVADAAVATQSQVV